MYVTIQERLLVRMSMIFFILLEQAAIRTSVQLFASTIFFYSYETLIVTMNIRS